MDAKHTPGPWKWWTSNSWRRLRYDDRGITMSVIEPFVARDGHPDLDVKQADMDLIAAAPDMLEALEAIDCAFDFSFMEEHGRLDDEQKAAVASLRAALAKATGQPASAGTEKETTDGYCRGPGRLPGSALPPL